MYKRIIHKSTVRYLIIFLLSVVLVTTAQMSNIFVSATSGGSDEETNIYKKILEGEYEPTEEGERSIIYAPFLDRIDKVIEVYHYRVNKLFNDRIKIIVNERNLDTLSRLLSPPEMDTSTDPPAARKDCKGNDQKKNVSTYCLAMLATEEYFEFTDGIIKAQQELPNTMAEAMGALKSSFDETPDTQAQYEAAAQAAGAAIGMIGSPAVIIGGTAASLVNMVKPPKTVEMLLQEVEVAKRTLDNALAVYNELQISLPLHRKYKGLMDALLKYRDKLAKIRDQVEQYPKTFYNISTTKCS